MKAMTRPIKASAVPVTSAAMTGAIDRSCHDLSVPHCEQPPLFVNSLDHELNFVVKFGGSVFGKLS